MTAPTLAGFLLARIAEDEAAAERGGYHNGGAVFARDNYGCLLVQPSHVLAECEAKRRIVEAVCTPGSEVREAVAAGRYNVRRTLEPCDEMGGDIILPLIAAVYADHPDYRDEWRP